jgi:hypothetical protein
MSNESTAFHPDYSQRSGHESIAVLLLIPGTKNTAKDVNGCRRERKRGTRNRFILGNLPPTHGDQDLFAISGQHKMCDRRLADSVARIEPPQTQ